MTNEPDGADALDAAEAEASEVLNFPNQAVGSPPNPTAAPDPPENMEDEQSMPGFEDDQTHVGGTAEVPSDGTEPNGDGAPPSDDGEQPSYLMPQVPENFILAPSDSTFANATWLRAGPEVAELVDEVLELVSEDTDFKALALMDWDVCWRRQTSPMRNGEPNYAGVWVPNPRVEWEVMKHGIEDFPRFVIDINWKHFADLLSDDQPAAVHRDYVKRDIHYALAGLVVENDRISTRPPVVLRPSNVKEFGVHGDEVRILKRQFDGWPELLDESGNA